MLTAETTMAHQLPSVPDNAERPDLPAAVTVMRHYAK